MNKILLTKNEIFDVIVNCYQSDNDLINKYHVVSGTGLTSCIDRTVSDFINNDVNIFKLQDNDQFIGYFGDLNGNWLTGFFVMPEKRKIYSSKVWEMIKSHFNNEFKTGIYTKNTRAASFLKKNGCVLEQFEITSDGIGEVYSFVKENI